MWVIWKFFNDAIPVAEPSHMARYIKLPSPPRRGAGGEVQFLLSIVNFTNCCSEVL